jgi:hypothetical protein
MAYSASLMGPEELTITSQILAVSYVPILLLLGNLILMQGRGAVHLCQLLAFSPDVLTGS